MTATGNKKAEMMKYLEGLDHIPQHRIRVSKRIIDYGDHPWHRYQDLNGIPVSGAVNTRKGKNAEIDSTEKSNIGHATGNNKRRLTQGFFEETLPKSGIKMWSTISGIDETPSSPVHNSDPNFNDTNNGTVNDSGASSISTHKDIRIRASLLEQPSTGSLYLNDDERRILLESIIYPALDTWSQALSVVPVLDRLIIDREQLYDSISCGPGINSGLPSVVVPLDHTEDGVEETDLMVYLNIGLQEERLNDKQTVNEESDSKRNLQKAKEWEETTSEPTTTPEENKISPCSGYLASSTYCSTDQYDRPLAGMLHICIGEDFFDSDKLETNQITILHELGHILGFNSQSLAHFRDRETGEPITEREEPHGDVKDVEVECAGVIEGRGSALIPLPSSKILQFKDVRKGQRVAQIVTPTVRQVARNHFDCQRLEGAELETYILYPTNKNANETRFYFADKCISDHWERRLFKGDLMNPIIDSVNSVTRISPLTLAYFMDSGWYLVNVGRATEPDIWGRGAGCDFVEEQCVTDGQIAEKNSQFFCTSDQDGCSDDMMGKASCVVEMYDYELAPEFQHFRDPTLGGRDMDMDFCPSFIGRKSDLCRTDHSKIARLEEFGETSRCLSGKHGKNKNAALCVPVACAIEERGLYVRVDGLWKECEYEGQVIQSWYDDGDYGRSNVLPRQ